MSSAGNEPGAVFTRAFGECSGDVGEKTDTRAWKAEALMRVFL